MIGRATSSTVVLSVAAGAAHLLVVDGLLLGLGHAPVGLSTGAGLALLGALPAGLRARWQLRLPGAVLVAGLVAALVVELVVPGPTVAVLGPDRLTTGVAVLANYATAWPLLLALVLLAAVAEWPGAVGTRPSRLRAVGAAVAAGPAGTGLVLLAVVVRGWIPGPAVPRVWGAAGLVVLGTLAVLLLLRTRLRAPALVLTGVLAVAVVASWITEPGAGHPASGLLLSGFVHLMLAVLLTVGELAVRGVVAAARRVRSRASAAASGRAASPSRS
ncbi:hypothetical protein ACQPZA_27720 [Pseudonocardia xinjiangensis]|uniref:hypothetical protein n=1 Tax=Pseudonocardia xinjiangensis TaxID=75289 RepID=UPI003D8A90A1